MKRFIDYAEGVQPFRDVVKEAEKPNAYTHLKGLDQEDTCHIAQAADLCIMLTKGLGLERGVAKQVGNVSKASWSEVSCLDSVPMCVSHADPIRQTTGPSK